NLALPPLRERPNDISRLAQFFADKYADANGVPRKKLAAETVAAAQAYPWRGNIRELENTMHRAILVSLEDEMEPAALGLQGGAFSTGAGTAASPNQAPGAGAVVGNAGGGAPPQNAPVSNQGAVETMIGRTIADVERDMIINT